MEVGIVDWPAPSLSRAFSKTIFIRFFNLIYVQVTYGFSPSVCSMFVSMLVRMVFWKMLFQFIFSTMIAYHHTKKMVVFWHFQNSSPPAVSSLNRLLRGKGVGVIFNFSEAIVSPLRIATGHGKMPLVAKNKLGPW